ncbi:MAG: type VI secretion system baseplate subunit TssE [Nitrospirales bacterium]|nr:type VI secretion system baseplate subunit TssE [Nitrospirales bacterium]
MSVLESRMGLVPSLLDRLLDDDPWVSTPLFTLQDVINPEGLVVKWREGENSFSQFVYEGQSLPLQQFLDECSIRESLSTEAREQVVGILNDLVNRDCLYAPKHFEGIILSEETIRLMQDQPTGRGLMFLNRMLIEDVYPNHLRTRRVSDTPYSLTELRQSLSRDLEALLNTRQEWLEDMPTHYKELPKSILLYGLPDFTAQNVMSSQDQKKIRRSIEQAIQYFEPRLRSVTVTFDRPEGLEQALHFRIEALLQIEPEPELVKFDAVLRLDTTKYDVTED